MELEEFNFILTDRIAKIQAINEQYDLENNSYISFSGGKDSVITHYLIDMAIPGNTIPRVYANTGIEYNLMVKYVKELAKNDKRIIILNQDKNIRKTLEEYGYPFKSKEHSQRVMEFNKNHNAYFIKKYITGITNKGTKTTFKCPDKLLYQFNGDVKYNYSNQCCFKLKKDLLHKFESWANRKIGITGMKKEEGGNRKNAKCIKLVGDKLKLFHPLIVVGEEWEEFFIKIFNIELCPLYNPPYNFKRSGCKGCPFNVKIQNDLETMYKLLPNEYKQCLHIWKPVYDEYIRIGYRLKEYPHEKGIQLSMFDILENGDDTNDN